MTELSGKQIELYKDQLLGEINETARNEALERVDALVTQYQSRANDAELEVKRLEAASEKSPEFNAEYYFEYHHFDGPGGKHDIPNTPENEGFTMANSVVKQRLLDKAKGEHGDWLLRYMQMRRVRKLISEI
jgi:hypothetical protein